MDAGLLRLKNQLWFILQETSIIELKSSETIFSGLAHRSCDPEGSSLHLKLAQNLIICVSLPHDAGLGCIRTVGLKSSWRAPEG